jgi:hypothetical protein
MPRNTTLAVVERAAPTLTASQTLALVALLAGESVTAAAGHAKTSRETVHRWLNDPVFTAELNRGKAELLSWVQADIRALALEATRTLREILTSDSASQALKFKASLAVLSMVGADIPEPIGPTDPEEIALAQKQREDDMTLRALVAGR